MTIPVPVFNMVPQVGEPARFGFEVVGNPVILNTAVRTGGDYGVVVSVDNLTQDAYFVASSVTLWGVPGDPRHNSSRGWECLQKGFFGTGAPCEPLRETGAPPPFLTLPTVVHDTVVTDGIRGLLDGAGGTVERGIRSA